MIRAAILTISDSVTAGTREDLSGPALREKCVSLKWQVTAIETRPDEVEAIAEQLRQWVADETIDVIVTTGGTGISARDVTPEATRHVIDREIPGMAEWMRTAGLDQTPFAPLSRAIVGAKGKTLIVNTPGSPKGAAHSLQAISHLVPHVVQLLRGNTRHSSEAGSGN